MKTEDLFDIDAPIKNARKRLDKWLMRERLYLPSAARDKAAAKLARIFENEDSDNPLIYQNFLTMMVDEEDEGAEDLTQVQSELKHIIKNAYPRKRIMFLSVTVVFLLFSMVFIILGSGKITVFPAQGTINSVQEKELKSLVSDIVDAEIEKGYVVSHGEIWKVLKTEFSISSYRDMPADNFEEGKIILENRLKEAQLKTRNTEKSK
ncbi:MAG: hypothetical protein ACRBDL_08195 [Alphaproteobacteria bacterium]